MSVDEVAFSGAVIHTQAGGFRLGRVRAASSGMRAPGRLATKRERPAFGFAPGRETTTIGASRAISFQRRQRWNCERLSPPMIQTNRTAGARRLSRFNKSI